MDKDKLLTVVIPVFNAEKYIATSLNSVIGSSIKNFDIILVENGSTDSTLKILKKYEFENDNIRLICLKENDLINAMNIGIRNSETKYIAIMDSDDFCPHERLEKQILFLEKNKDFVLVGTSIYYFIDKEKKWKLKLPLDNNEIIDGIKKYRQMIFNPTIMFRKESAVAANFYRFEDHTVPDIGFFLRMSKLGKLSNISEIYQGIRLSKKSFTTINFNDIIKKQLFITKNFFYVQDSKRTINVIFFYHILFTKKIYRKAILNYLMGNYFIFICLGLLVFFINPFSGSKYIFKKLVFHA